jgi:hypothetical protein
LSAFGHHGSQLLDVVCGSIHVDKTFSCGLTGISDYFLNLAAPGLVDATQGFLFKRRDAADDIAR